MPDMSDRKEAAAAVKIRVNPHSADTAWKYLDNHHSTTHGEDSDLKALRRRVDWHIVPLAFLCYTMQFIDKVLINVIYMCFSSSIPFRTLTFPQYAAVMGLPKDLKLKGNNFSNAATAFFIAYLIAEVPNSIFAALLA